MRIESREHMKNFAFIGLANYYATVWAILVDIVRLMVADIGAINQHPFKRTGLLEPDGQIEQQLMIQEKRRSWFGAAKYEPGQVGLLDLRRQRFPGPAMLWYKCNTKALVLLDGCQTWLSFAYSKGR